MKLFLIPNIESEFLNGTKYIVSDGTQIDYIDGHLSPLYTPKGFKQYDLCGVSSNPFNGGEWCKSPRGGIHKADNQCADNKCSKIEFTTDKYLVGVPIFTEDEVKKYIAECNDGKLVLRPPVNDTIAIESLNVIMDPFHKASYNHDAIDTFKKELMAKFNLSEAEAALQIAISMDGQLYKNDVYTVLEKDIPGEDGNPDMIWLSIKRNDRECIRDWRDLQKIKNMLVGMENEGVELYPAESRLVDSANQYHLWVIKDPGIRFPFGFKGRGVNDVPVGKSKQRKFD